MLGEPEVDELEVPFVVNEEVLRLEIPIRHAQRVDVLEGTDHAGRVEHAGRVDEATNPRPLDDVELLVD
eukprot:6444401-Prorocentrum_lima.AAC.1